jgi:hypothetical protein
MNLNSAKFGVMNITLRFKSKAGMLKDGKLYFIEVATFKYTKYSKDLQNKNQG